VVTPLTRLTGLHGKSVTQIHLTKHYADTKLATFKPTQPIYI
jgi:hypothetical protein